MFFINTLNTKSKQNLFLSFALFHFLVIILISISTTINSWYQLYHENSKQNKEPRAIKTLNSISRSFLISNYTFFTGLDTGYGFFAPNVASVCQIQFIVKNESNKIIDILYMPEFSNVESISRYATLMGKFQERLKQYNVKEKSNYLLYLDVVVKSMSKQILKKYPPKSKMDVILFLPKYPTLKQFNQGVVTPSYIPIDSYKVNYR
ncbi:hypothetical protein OC25_02645 [Pedobacter kyungheensis]|uniref:Uncharacterized protein n=1 Tax=Pedobacter kyungheensis TaxID=1069985 RepID=A0A0C1G953_9SPHI|nr:hypothetical protein [Pedobacter kyungheensis]KIA96639.1 hypothetical protein OC25_02645 [Pedobacter kyungheensis]